MRKLQGPSYHAIELYDECVASMPESKLRRKFVADRAGMVTKFDEFDQHTLTKTWCELPRADWGKPDTKIVGELSKAELVALYNEQVVNSSGRPRLIYDQIKLAAHGECPYCGGLGEMGEDGGLGTADHFLPKSRFPAYSVLPLNLVPACKICNSGMGSNFPTNPHLQPIHPYLDNLHFFNERWVFASLREAHPVVFDFTVAPPAGWSRKDQSRVRQHFTDCKLESRYRVRAWQEITPLISQRKTSLRQLSSDDFRSHLAVIADEAALPVNGWKRTLYQGLASSDWFCGLDFVAEICG